jgi:penicillin-binding protein 1B
MVGGRRPRFAGFNRALDAVRPVGSLIKPAVYLAALEDGSHTLASLISDGPVSVEGQDGSLWEPLNFDKRSHGEIPLHLALSKSYNQASARLGMGVGLPRIVETLHRLGVERDVPELPSVILGSLEMSPFDIAGMYQTIAAGGYRTPLRSIREITTASGELLRRYPLTVEQRVSSEAIHLLHYVLQEVMREGTGRSAYQYLPQSLAVAGKTGTTDEQRDSWFVGFSGDRLGVVWLGHDDNSPTPLTGSSGALAVWAQLMSMSARQSVVFNKPEQVAYHWVDDKTGLLSGKNCQYARKLPFVVGTEPSQRGTCEPRRGALMKWFKDML